MPEPPLEVKIWRGESGFRLKAGGMDAPRDSLIKHRVGVTPRKLGCDQSWQCGCKDPDGTEMEFQQFTPKSSQFMRANCIVDS